MCEQVGIIFGRKRTRPDERYLCELFIRMLLHSEERGPHASGSAWLKTDGSHRIFKRPMRAHELVLEKPFIRPVPGAHPFRASLRLFKSAPGEFASRSDERRAGIKARPRHITVLKGNKPLCLALYHQHREVLYASDDGFIDFAVDSEKDWRELEVPPMTMLTIRHKDVRAIENSEFRFISQERKK